MKYDGEIAALLFAGLTYYYVKRNVPNMLVWVVLTYIVTQRVFHLSHTLSVLLGVVVVYIVAYWTTGYTIEMFENEKKDEGKEEKKEPEAHTTKATDPHVDLGTTILHAYRNLTPEQIGGMRRDTKELMELQKELMGTLAEMKPAIEQGAQMLGTFTKFFSE
jgi:hypothetical protein